MARVTPPADAGAAAMRRYAELRAAILAALRDGNGMALERARADMYALRRVLRAAGVKTVSGDAIVRRWRAKRRSNREIPGRSAT